MRILLFCLLLVGCSKDFEPMQFVKSEPYHFVEEFVIWNGVQYPLNPICPITFNDVYVSGGIITIATDCFLTDGFFQSAFTDMKFDIDEIVVLGEAIVLSHPNEIEIAVCTANQIQLIHRRPSHNEVFYAIYEK